MNRLFILGCALLVASIAMAAEGSDRPAKRVLKGQTMTGAWRAEIPATAIVHPWPKYPYLARLHALDGRGVFQLNVDYETGKVTEVKVVETTTHKILDDAAIEGFSKWRFQPRSERKILMPAQFGIVGKPIGRARSFAIHAPSPQRPRSGRSGKGTFRFIVDYETGRVLDVKIVKSTGRKDFDESVLKAYRQWKFRPRTVREIDTTVAFAP